MIKIGICDDEINIAAKIEEKIQQLGASYPVKFVTDVFYDGSTLVNYILNGYSYDIIYLDIEMENKNGIDAAREIRNIDKQVLIIYVTNHESFAKDVFEVSAFRFLVKPINDSIFNKYFNDALALILHEPHYFRYHYNKIMYRIEIDKIMYFQSDKRVTYIISDKEIRKCYEKLNEIEKKLNQSNIYFLRIHQSFMVNPKYIAKYTFDTIQLIDDTTLAISVNRRKKISMEFCKLKGEDIIVE